MIVRTLAAFAAILVSGCTTGAFVRGFVLPDCEPGPTSSPTAHAAKCMTAALYEIAQEEREESEDESDQDQEEDVPAPAE